MEQLLDDARYFMESETHAPLGLLGERESVAERRGHNPGCLAAESRIVRTRLNSSVSNRAWTVKREKIRKSDNLFLNKRLLEESDDRWTEDDIEQRGRWMGDMIVKIWPRE